MREIAIAFRLGIGRPETRLTLPEIRPIFGF